VGRPAPRLESLQFHWPAPAGKWNAISQGRELAEQERRRLDLGSQPIWELTEILGEQGVRVGVEPLPNDISGITLNGSGLGVLIVVNGSQAAPRRTFACAHEYAHALVDRDAPARVSRAAAGDDLLEVRANAFAAHFLMPEVGVREFLRSAGKGDGSRQAQRVPQPDRVAEGTEELAAYRRHAPSAREISAVDVTQIADRFGASYSAAIYQLSNLKFVSEEQAARLRGEEAGVRRFGEMIGIGGEKVGVGPTLTRSIVALGAEALRRELISRRKFLELASEAGLDLEALEPAIAEAGLAGGPVGVELPD
jgi:Zn-dependent peptidase ImmA (M78 family)